VRRLFRTVVDVITRILAPAFVADRARRVERGPVDAELARDLRERRTGGGGPPTVRPE